MLIAEGDECFVQYRHIYMNVELDMSHVRHTSFVLIFIFVTLARNII